jgi:hypothetical protein
MPAVALTLELSSTTINMNNIDGNKKWNALEEAKVRLNLLTSGN